MPVRAEQQDRHAIRTTCTVFTTADKSAGAFLPRHIAGQEETAMSHAVSRYTETRIDDSVMAC